MKIKEFMVKKVYTLKPEDTVLDAIELLANKEISGAPVVKEGKVKGIISDTDLIKVINVYGKIHAPSKTTFGLVLSVLKGKGILEGIKEGVKKLKEAKVKEIMSKKLVTINQEEDLSKAVRLFDRHDITRIPVVDKKGKLVGIVCRGEIIKALHY